MIPTYTQALKFFLAGLTTVGLFILFPGPAIAIFMAAMVGWIFWIFYAMFKEGVFK